MKLIRESDWVRVYKNDDSTHFESKFLDPAHSISFGEFTRRWPSMTEVDRVEFAQAFFVKEEISYDDQEIAFFIFRSGGRLPSCIAPMFPRLPDRETALTLLHRELSQPAGIKANIFQALEWIGNPQSKHAIEGALARLEGSQEHDALYDYLTGCRAMWKLGSPQHLQKLREFEDSADKEIARQAKHLQVS